MRSGLRLSPRFRIRREGARTGGPGASIADLTLRCNFPAYRDGNSPPAGPDRASAINGRERLELAV